jgi:hypothetical protein
VPGYLFLGAPVRVRVSVADFGAIGDGVTDSSAAFLNATEHVSSGGEITVPAGVFLTSPITLPSHTRLLVLGEMRGRRGADADQALVSWYPDAVNVSVVGNGTIANRGNSWSTSRVDGNACPFFYEHNMPSGSIQYTTYAGGPIECEASERQRASLFAPLGVAPMVPERKWRPTRGKLQSLRATPPELEQLPKSCLDILVAGGARGDMDDYEIFVLDGSAGDSLAYVPMTVTCDMTGGGWTKVTNVLGSTPQSTYSVASAVSRPVGDTSDVFWKLSDTQINAISSVSTSKCTRNLPLCVQSPDHF